MPVRLLPGQPSAEAAKELEEALEFYLHDPMVDAPIEFFHSALASMRGAPTGSLWRVLEEDPAIYQRSENKSLAEIAGLCAEFPGGTYPTQGRMCDLPLAGIL